METGMIIGGVLLAVAVLILFTLNRLIIIVPPNMAAAITGRKRALGDGSSVGYRTVTGGRTLRIMHTPRGTFRLPYRPSRT
jgi:flotillin